MRYASVVAVLVFGCSLVVVPHAQQNPRTIGAGPGSIVAVDFVAVDAKGQPVADLSAADITVRIDGKPRDVRALQFVRRELPAVVGMPTADPLPAPFASNASQSGSSRAVLIIFDNETMVTGREQRVKDGVLALINLLGPRDQAAIVTVPHGGVATDLTSDRVKLREAAGKLLGTAPNAETADEAACRSRLTVQAITSLLALRAGAETPTEVVFVSSNLSGPRSNVTAGTTGLGRGSIGGCQLPSDEFTRLGIAAASARAHFYIVQPEQVRTTSTTGDLDSPLAGLENIASLTGGFIWHMAGSDEPGFQRVATETAGYYSATVELDPADRNNATRQMSVKTSRADVIVRARPSIAFGQPSAATTAPAPKEMLRSPTSYRDTPLRIAAYASRNAGDGKVKIVALAESAGAAKFSAAAIGVYDTANKLVAQWSADAAALTAPALVAAFVQSPGHYRVRVAATDSAGHAGTADYDLDATLTPAAGGLTLSAMVLGTPDNNFTPKLQFGSEPQAVAYFELYGGKQGMPVSVVVELASTLNGPATAQIQPKISGSSEPDKYIIMAPIALGALPPGDYVIRAIVGLDGQPAGRIVRTLRKIQ